MIISIIIVIIIININNNNNIIIIIIIINWWFRGNVISRIRYCIINMEETMLRLERNSQFVLSP